jgi:hypothetical protein
MSLVTEIERLKSDVPISSVAGSAVKLRAAGTELAGLCPFHQERSPSFTVNDSKGFYHCFGCGAHGDVVGFVMRYRNVTAPEAVRILGGDLGNVVRDIRPPASYKPPPDPEPEWQPISPVPADAPPLFAPNGETVELVNPKRKGEPGELRTWSRPTLVHPYQDAAGQLLGFVLRFEFERDGKRRKVPAQITFCSGPAGARRWAVVNFSAPRPIFGLDLLAARPRDPVLWIEGEKTAEAARRLLGDKLVCIASPGGCKGLGYCDWQPLAGRDVTILGDADQEGRDAVYGYQNSFGGHVPGLVEILTPIAHRVRPADIPTDVPKGWDLADAEAEGWTPTRTLTWLRAGLKRAPAAPQDAAA